MVNGKVTEFRVNLKVTFVLKDAPKVAAKAVAKTTANKAKSKKK